MKSASSYHFIHNTYAHFFKDTLDYFAEYLYPRFEHTVIGTYDKAVEYIIKKTEYEGREIEKPRLPALILNPSGDFSVADTGLQLYRWPNIAGGMVSRMWNPIYQDKNVKVTPAFTRITGDIELLILLPSFYEFCDVKMMLLQIFGGMERYIYPIFFHSFIILPTDIYSYEYENDVTGLTYKLNWEEAGSTDELVKTTNRTEHVFPCRIKPIYKMTGLSDGSTRYGGADRLADWRLSVTISYQVEIPSYLMIESDYLADHIKCNINYGSAYSENSSYNSDKIPVNIQAIRTSWSSGLDETSSSTLDMDSTAEVEVRDLVFRTRYYHVVTQAEADSTSNYTIALPETITDIDLIRLQSKYGEVPYGDYYTLVNSGNAIEINVTTTDFSAGEILEIYVYGEV